MARVDEHFSNKQAHTSGFSTVLQSFYRHELNLVPEVQYHPTWFHCLLRISNLPRLSWWWHKNWDDVSCFLIHTSFFTPSHRSPLAWNIPALNFAMPAFTLVLTGNSANCFGGLESLRTCYLGYTPAVWTATGLFFLNEESSVLTEALQGLPRAQVLRHPFMD